MVFSTIKDVISFISQLCAGRISYICELEKNLNTLRTSIEEMKDVRDDVRERVEIQEANRMRRTHQVAGWLERADTIEDQVERILKEGYEDLGDRFLGGFFPANCYASLKLGEQVVQKIKDVDDLKGQGRGFEIVAVALPPPLVQEMLAAPTTGMDLQFEKAWSWISKEQGGIMGIYGLGGVGKTTLLKRINNEFLSSQTLHFDVVIWVVVSKEVKVKKIQDDVAKRLDLPLPEDESLDHRAVTLNSALTKKTFVLLLDDIWEPVDLIAIGIPHPNIINKSKVLFTTRFEDVCGQMKARENIKVECLDSAEAWKLFQEEVGEEALNSHPEIPAIAKQVAKECDGLPLALITTGKAMVSMKTPREWRHQLTILKKFASQFSGMEEKVYSILKFSYDRLPDNTVKSCFLYCSLFPEDHSIDIQALIRYWIGEGFLDEFDDMDEAEDKGYAIIRKLQRACLLEGGLYSPTEEVKMHDVLRDLALWIGCDNGRNKNKLLVRAGVLLTEAPEVGKWREAERISLMSNEIKKLGDEAPECPSLLTLIISQNYGLSNISNGFFQHMRVLRVLNLSHTRINVLPMSIVELIELEYLGLRRTDIIELPREIKNLVKLKCLDLSSTENLKFIPCGILSRFSRLQVLDFSYSNFKHWEVESGDIGQDDENVGASIEELGCLRDLQYLSINITNLASLNRILASEKLARCTRRLYVSECQQLTPMILNHRSLSNIRHIDTYEGLICDGITGGFFPNLRRVGLHNCNSLKDLSWLRGCPNLAALEVFHCKGLERIICDVEDAEVKESPVGIFSRLSELALVDLPDLKSIPWQAIPSDTRIVMSGCPQATLSNEHNILRPDLMN